MKKFYIFCAFIAAFTLVSTVFAQTLPYTAQSYDNAILHEQARIVNDNIHYISQSLFDHQAFQSQAERNAIIQHIDEAQSHIMQLPVFQGDASLKTAALEVLARYKKIYSLDCRKADSLSVNGKSSYEALKYYFDLQNQAEAHLAEAGQKFVKAQQTFARKHKLQKKDGDFLCFFSRIAEANAYARRTYLRYVRLQEMSREFFAIMKKRQFESAEKQRQRILHEAAQILASLERHHLLDAQGEYVLQAQSLTRFIQQSANTDYVEIMTIAQNKTATFHDANRSAKIIVNYHQKHKTMLADFQKSGRALVYKAVMPNVMASTLKQNPQQITTSQARSIAAPRLVTAAQKTPQTPRNHR